MASVPRITVDALKRRMDEGEDFTLIDTRNPSAWSESDLMLPGAIRVPLEDLEENLSRVPRDRPAVAYCSCPNEESSGALAKELEARGYDKIWALQGGFEAWRRAGYPIQTRRKAA